MLDAGEHVVNEELLIERDLTIAGVCARETRLVLGGGLRVRSTLNLQSLHLLSQGEGPRVEPRGTLRAERVALRVGGHGIVAQGAQARVQLRDVVLEWDGTGSGLEARDRAEITASRLVLRGTRGVTALVRTGGVLGIDNGLIDGGEGESHPRGIDAQEGTVALESVALRGLQDHGVLAASSETRITLTDVAIRDVYGAPGDGVRAEGHGTITATRLRVEGANGAGLVARGHGSLRAEEVWVHTSPRTFASEIGGHGVAVDSQGRIELDRALIDKARTRAATSVGAGSSLILRDTWIRGTRPDSGLVAVGVGAYVGGFVHATRVRVENSHQAGIKSTDPGTRIELSDSVVCDTRQSRMSADFLSSYEGPGLVADLGATLLATRVLVEHSAGTGVSVTGTMTLRDVAVVDTDLISDTGRQGIGVVVTRDLVVPECATTSPARSTLDAENLLISGSREGGLAVWGAGASARLRQTLITGTSPSACGYGLGVGVAAGGSIEAQQLAITEVYGAAIGAAPFVVIGPGCEARIQVQDLFAWRIHRGVIDPEFVAGRCEQQGARAAYGVSMGDLARVTLERAVLSEGGFGFFVANNARSFEVRNGVIDGMCEGFGAQEDEEIGRVIALQNVDAVRSGAQAVRPDLVPYRIRFR